MCCEHGQQIETLVNNADNTCKNNVSFSSLLARKPSPKIRENHESAIHQDGSDEFKCVFHWNKDKFQELKTDILDRMKSRQKSFIRFTVPVMGYTNMQLSMHKERALLTWVWVLTKHNYALHYPQNFIRISLASMGIITEDWALDYNDIVPVSLREFSFDIDDDNYEYEANVGQCDPDCVRENKSCGIGKHDLVDLINNITDGSEDYEWEWICLQLPYHENITELTGSQPNFVVPDVLYYMLFLERLLVERPPLGIPKEKHKFKQYHCYHGSNLSVSKGKEVLEKYYVIPFIALALWLYAPLLIHYFPSSSVKANHAIKTPAGMFPSHKSPKYLGRCLKKMLCYYPPGNSGNKRVRLRRLLFLSLVLLSSYRIFFLPYYGKFACVIALVLTLALLCPQYISKHVNVNARLSFMGWVVPPHLVHINPDLEEYQLLGAVMEERVYLLFDCRFWDALIKQHVSRMFAALSWTGSNPLSTIVRCAILKPLLFLLLFICAVVNTLYFIFPVVNFTKEIGATVLNMTFAAYQHSPSVKNKLLSTIQGVFVFCGLLHIILVVFFWCYAFVEVSLFTLMGGALLPSMAFPYFVLVGSIVEAVYSLIHSLHEDYDNIISTVIDLLGSEGTIPIERELNPPRDRVRDLIKTEDVAVPTGYTISVIIGKAKKEEELMRCTVVVTFLSRKLFDFVVEECQPLRRQMPLVVLQILGILFYVLIIMWVKNVYHLEAEVDQIFSLASIVAVTYVPSLLKYLAYKSYFGLNREAVSKQNVYFAIVDYITELDRTS